MTNPQQLPDADSLTLGGGIKSVSLPNIGDSIEGYIIAKDVVQEKEYSNDPSDPPKYKTFDDGSPIPQLVLTLQTTLREDTDDDGKRKVYFKRDWRKELSRVLRDAGEKTIPIGGWVRLLRDRDEPGKGPIPKKMVRIDFRAAADQITTSSQATAQPQAQTATGGLPAGVVGNPELEAAYRQLQASGALPQQ